MPTAAATDLLRELVQGILGNPAEAQAYSQNPSEYLAAHGVADHDYSGLDVRELMVEAAKECELSEPAKALVDDYAKGGPEGPPPGGPAGGPAPGPAPAGGPAPAPAGGPAPGPAPAGDPGPAPAGGPAPAPADGPAPAGGPAPAPEAAPMAVAPPPMVPPADMTPLQAIEQHINYVTYVTHQTDNSVVQNLIDNSVNVDNSSSLSVDVGGNMYGDIDLTNDVRSEVDVVNVNATGDGAVAAGDDIRDSNINTGSGNITQVGDIHANDSAVAIGGDATNVQDHSQTNIDQSISDSFNDNSDNSVNTDINVDITDNSTNDSFNTDVDISDSFQVNDSFNTETNVDNSTNYGQGHDDGYQPEGDYKPEDGGQYTGGDMGGDGMGHDDMGGHKPEDGGQYTGGDDMGGSMHEPAQVEELVVTEPVVQDLGDVHTTPSTPEPMDDITE